jgi:hypothetical protein
MNRGIIHEVLSPESISILAQSYGAGTYLYVPLTTTAAEANGIAVLIGMAETAKLVSDLGGTRVYLPGLQPSNTAEIVKLSRRLSARAIAKKLGISERTVFLKRSQAKGNSSE